MGGVPLPFEMKICEMIELIHDIKNGTRFLSTDNLDQLMEVMS
jgi:hypothetical protein